MCMSCGCGKPNDTQGNPDNITLDMMQKAAQAANIDVEQAADNIHNAARQYRNQQAGQASMGRSMGDSTLGSSAGGRS